MRVLKRLDKLSTRTKATYVYEDSLLLRPSGIVLPPVIRRGGGERPLTGERDLRGERTGDRRGERPGGDRRNLLGGVLLGERRLIGERERRNGLGDLLTGDLERDRLMGERLLGEARRTGLLDLRRGGGDLACQSQLTTNPSICPPSMCLRAFSASS